LFPFSLNHRSDLATCVVNHRPGSAGGKHVGFPGQSVLLAATPLFTFLLTPFNIYFFEVMDTTRKYVTKAMEGKSRPQIIDFSSSRMGAIKSMS